MIVKFNQILETRSDYINPNRQYLPPLDELLDNKIKKLIKLQLSKQVFK